ncbi:hypothetical protein BJ165DRAFT_1532760 [Panaeolus papilionaceus]|nr:hypothetical protein BJ165DRAFT_1532760 [Panaeolus papilionaceus]
MQKFFLGHLNQHKGITEVFSNSPGLVYFLVALALYIYWKICDLLLGPKRVANLGPSMQRDVLAALTSVFIPVKAACGYQYQDLFANASVLETTKQIHVNANQLFKNLVNGNLETRSTEDISLLLQGKLLVYGWNVQLLFSSKWQIVIFGWILGQYMRVHNFRYPRIFEDSSPARVDMDHLPSGEKEKVIDGFAQLRTGDSIVLEFTSVADHIKWPSQHFIGCAIPFLPTNKCICTQQHPERFSALLYSLQDYMTLLVRQGVVISNLTNISAKRRHILEKRAEDFAINKEWRNAFIAHHNIACWRATRLKLLWEAGLLASGLVTRWRLTVTKAVLQKK